MRYLLDTNACIDYLRRADSPIRQRLESLPAQDVFICSIVLGELIYGAYRSTDVALNFALIDTLRATVASLPFDDEVAEIFGELRAQLAKTGKPIGPYDLQIAATALANDLVLVTHNTSEFSRVPALQLDDWLVP
jgi:tRNA(fMet)-specific endonuclease VapC